MANGYARFTANGQTDATVQPEVIKWMEDNAWQEAHFVWHVVRRCGAGFGGGAVINPCNFPEMKPEQNECAGPQDGYEFLVMHRHMIQALKELWPNHTEQFTGWTMFPGRSNYPDILQQYFSEWPQQVRTDAALADSINTMSRDEILRRWPTEGHFGQWLQCGSLSGSIGAASLHGALHFNGYPRNNQAHSVANQRRNLDAYLFWKLHGWIDNVWEKYRVAVNSDPGNTKLNAEMLAQCKEMEFWAQKIDPSLVPVEEPYEEVEEEGYFHEYVRPALERAGCATCHGAGEEAELRLGYQISSADIVNRLVNVDAVNVNGFKLVVPGDPDRSWLYLKANGQSVNSTATCRLASCKNRMPPGGMAGMTQQELGYLRQWILDGAPVPVRVE